MYDLSIGIKELIKVLVSDVSRKPDKSSSNSTGLVGRNNDVEPRCSMLPFNGKAFKEIAILLKCLKKFSISRFNHALRYNCSA